MEFKSIIEMYLDAMASKDTDFAKHYANEQKSLDECVLFIQSEMYKKALAAVKDEKQVKAACAVPTDDEVFALAVRYYNDPDLKIDGTSFDNVKVLSMAATTFTDEEKAQMRQDAIKKYQDEVIREQKKKAKEAAEKKAGKGKAKPATPVLVPDAPATAGEQEQEDKPKTATQLSLF